MASRILKRNVLHFLSIDIHNLGFFSILPGMLDDYGLTLNLTGNAGYDKIENVAGGRYVNC